MRYLLSALRYPLTVSLLAAGCATAPEPRAEGVYAHDSRALVRLDYDYDGDGRIDVRTYMRNGRPVRLEGDGNRDGVIDRWEYYGGNGALLRIGGSTRGDGHEDTWVRLHGGLRIVDISTARDGHVDRQEEYEGETLVRVASDTNGDRLSDRWEEFRRGTIVRLLIDDDRRHGRPTRRIVYEGRETTRVETDIDGDGTWEAASHAR
jgi:hypothetical protein